MNKLNIMAFGDFYKKNLSFFMFLFFLFVYFLVGIFLTYANDVIINVPWDFVYNMDSGRVFSSNVFPFDKWGTPIDKHPFSIVFVIPIINLFNKFFNSNILGLLFAQSLFASLSVCVVNSILNLISDKTKINFLLTLIYGFSYTLLIFSAIPEDYIFISLFVSLNLYYVFKILQGGAIQYLSKKQIFILTFFMFLCFSINSVCFFSNLILLICLLVCIYKKNIYKIVFDLIKILLLFVCFVFVFSVFHSVVYERISIFFLFIDDCFLKKAIDFHKSEFLLYDMDIKSLMYTIRGFFVAPFYSLANTIKSMDYLSTKSGWEFSSGQNFLIYIPCLVFLLSPIVHFFMNIKKYSDKRLMIICCVLLVFFFVVYFLYLPLYCFLFSNNDFVYIIALLCILLSRCESLYFVYLCIVFLLFQIINNFYNIFLLNKFASGFSAKRYDVDLVLQKTFFVFVLFVLFLFVLNKLIKIDGIKRKIDSVCIHNKYLIGIVIYLCFIIFYNIYMLIINFNESMGS